MPRKSHPYSDVADCVRYILVDGSGKKVRKVTAADRLSPLQKLARELQGQAARSAVVPTGYGTVGRRSA